MDSASRTGRASWWERGSQAVGFSLAALGILCAEEAPSLGGLRVTQAGSFGPPALRVDLVILGDGYLAEDFKPGGKWEIDAVRLVKNFFEKEPFKTERSVFNVHLVEVPSLDRGADDRPGNDKKKTAFNCTFGYDGIDRLLCYQDEGAVLRAARNAPTFDIILVLINDPREGGSGGTIGDGIPSPCCSTESTAYLTAIHELGHSFADLGDEYVDEAIADNYPLPESGDIPSPNLTLKRLVDISSKESLIATLKWGHFLDEPGAERKYGRGYWEGGYYREKGVYRPAPVCVMSDGAQFCFVCSEEMRRAIYTTSGRGPGGGIFPAAVPRMGGLLRRPHFFYTQGLFGKVVSDLKKIAKSKNVKPADLQNMKNLEAGIRQSYKEGLAKAEKLARAGEAVAAEENLKLMETSFKSTDLQGELRARTKVLSSSPEFKKELEAGRELLKLQSLARSVRLSPPQARAFQKRVEAFLEKHAGTKSAEKGKSLLNP